MPNPSRILAIGDVHGCAVALDALLRAANPAPDDLIVTLGDYVDRGLDSAGVLNRLLRLDETHRLVALRGNHEQMMMSAREGDGELAFWLSCGGEATLMSYCPFDDRGTLADVPDEHWDFLENRCVDWFETEGHIFVHGGVIPDRPLEGQPPLVLRWQVFRDVKPHVSGKVMVCGHTPQEGFVPRSLGHAVCIDTRAYDDEGWLTCLDVNGGRYWQANERGEVREGVVGEHEVRRPDDD